MLEDQESEFILSIFLMEAWDTVASVEEGVRRLAVGDPPSSAIVDPLVVVAHRLKGASALHGYPVVSAVALVVESAANGDANTDDIAAEEAAAEEAGETQAAVKVAKTHKRK